MNDGRIFHKLLLEGQTAFDRDCVIAPNLHPNSNDYKAWKQHQVKSIVAESDFREAKTNIDYLKQGTDIESILSGGYPEVAILWTDENGVARRSKIDYLTQSTIIDLKSFTDWKDDNSHIRNYFWQYKVFCQLMDYLEAVKVARNLSVIKGTKKQKDFWESCRQNPDWLLLTCFVNREMPQMVLKTFRKEKCPDLWKLGEKQRKQAMDNFIQYLERYGANNAWITQQDPETLEFTDFDFPGLMSI